MSFRQTTIGDWTIVVCANTRRNCGAHQRFVRGDDTRIRGWKTRHVCGRPDVEPRLPNWRDALIERGDK